MKNWSICVHHMFAPIFLTKKGQNEAKLYDFFSHKMCFFVSKERTSNSGPLGCASCIFDLHLGWVSRFEQKEEVGLFFHFLHFQLLCPTPYTF